MKEDTLRYFIMVFPEKINTGSLKPEPYTISVVGHENMLKELSKLGRTKKVSVYRGECLLDWS